MFIDAGTNTKSEANTQDKVRGPADASPADLAALAPARPTPSGSTLQRAAFDGASFEQIEQM